MSPKPCCTVSFGSDVFPRGETTWYVTWLPKGYGPTSEDKLICAFPDMEDYASGGKRPPLIDVVVKAIEGHFAAAPVMGGGAGGARGHSYSETDSPYSRSLTPKEYRAFCEARNTGLEEAAELCDGEQDLRSLAKRIRALKRSGE